MVSTYLAQLLLLSRFWGPSHLTQSVDSPPLPLLVTAPVGGPSSSRPPPLGIDVSLSHWAPPGSGPRPHGDPPMAPPRPGHATGFSAELPGAPIGCTCLRSAVRLARGARFREDLLLDAGPAAARGAGLVSDQEGRPTPRAASPEAPGAATAASVASVASGLVAQAQGTTGSSVLTSPAPPPRGPARGQALPRDR